MHAFKSSPLVPRLQWLREATSTNSVLVDLASGPDAAGWSDLSVVATDTQTEGRGRLGRSWTAPAGASLAVSVLLRPQTPSGRALPVEALGWLPLLGGAAMARAVNRFLGRQDGPGGQDAAGGQDADGSPARAVLKWPNDVLIGGAKVSGVLSELLPGARGVVVGAGVNLFLSRDELPVPTATSLTLEGASGITADDVLAAYLSEFISLYRPFVVSNGDAEESGLAATVSSLCATLGQPVQVELPGGDIVLGLATALDPSGRLVVARDVPVDGDDTLVVAAGDVTHLRY